MNTRNVLFILALAGLGYYWWMNKMSTEIYQSQDGTQFYTSHSNTPAGLTLKTANPWDFV